MPMTATTANALIEDDTSDFVAIDALFSSLIPVIQLD